MTERMEGRQRRRKDGREEGRMTERKDGRQRGKKDGREEERGKK